MSTHDDTAPITYAEALTVTRAMFDAASTVSVLVEYETSGIVMDPSSARQCRAAADFLAVMHKAASPSILRHVADRIDPRTAPAEPDLTTPEGWIAEATEARLVTSEMHAPNCDAERVALHDAWLEADADSQIEACLARQFMLCVKL